MIANTLYPLGGKVFDAVSHVTFDEPWLRSEFLKCSYGALCEVIERLIESSFPNKPACCLEFISWSYILNARLPFRTVGLFSCESDRVEQLEKHVESIKQRLLKFNITSILIDSNLDLFFEWAASEAAGPIVFKSQLEGTIHWVSLELPSKQSNGNTPDPSVIAASQLAVVLSLSQPADLDQLRGHIGLMGELLEQAQYPKFRIQFLEQHRIESKADQPAKHSAKRAIQALQFLHDNEKQLVQARAQGFSFNRLAPYTSLDDYLPELHRTWGLFVGIASPIQIRVVRLRYINRILLPLTDGRVDLDHYFKVSPRLPDENKLQFAGFLNQHSAVEVDTGQRACVH